MSGALPADAKLVGIDIEERVTRMAEGEPDALRRTAK
jgi:hypothetical protein